MSTVLNWVALAGALWAVVLVVVDRAPVLGRPDGWAYAGVLALIELGVLVQAAIGLVMAFTTDRDVERWTLAGYLLGALFAVPIAAYWANAERTRWGTAVLVVGCLVVPVLNLRMGQVWGG
ncbi:hypothetical protein [Actinokineospora bangkokensis]|uniref:hypothetical protein n=1 Tax=Actinokineospora bangkokensis TaxID=1193682 RepID=UPI001E38779D|nr:hypothetical protein [Actinokineospora bangkokensis]